MKSTRLFILLALWSSALFAMEEPNDLDYQEFFESELANVVVQFPQAGTAAHSVSQGIVSLLTNERTAARETLSQGSLFEELKKTMYKKTVLGHLSDPKESMDDVLDDLQKTCDNPNTPIGTVMRLHATWGFQVIRNLKARNGKGEQYAQAHAQASSQNGTHSFQEIQFGKDIRKMKPDEEVGLSEFQGTITEQSRFAQKTRPLHFRGRDKFSIDPSKGETKSAIKKVFGTTNIPIAAGPSAHAMNELSSAYAMDDSIDMKGLAFLIACDKTHAGHHSFHEVVRVADLEPFNVPYKANKYAEYVPDSFKQTKSYQELALKYESTPWLAEGR